jgi:hypothetical protein
MIVYIHNEPADYETVCGSMDSEIFQQLKRKLQDTNEQDFLDEYCQAHWSQFGQDFLDGYCQAHWSQFGQDFLDKYCQAHWSQFGQDFHV